MIIRYLMTIQWGICNTKIKVKICDMPSTLSSPVKYGLENLIQNCDSSNSLRMMRSAEALIIWSEVSRSTSSWSDRRTEDLTSEVWIPFSSFSSEFCTNRLLLPLGRGLLDRSQVVHGGRCFRRVEMSMYSRKRTFLHDICPRCWMRKRSWSESESLLRLRVVSTLLRSTCSWRLKKKLILKVALLRM